MEHIVLTALNQTRSLSAFLVQEGKPVPQLSPGVALATVYVDNALILGFTKEETTQAMSAVTRALDLHRFKFHELEEPTKRIGF
eukprot:4699694-Amphidinium_carterae.1